MADLARRMFAVLAIVIVIIPVAVGAPTMLVFIPPAVRAAPATLTRFVQLMASFVRLAAVASMMLDGFMKTMIRLGDAFLAIVIIGAQTRSAGEEQESRQSGTGQRYFSRSQNSRQFCLHPVLL